MKYSNMTLGTLEAIVNKLGGEDAAMAFLRGVFEVVRVKLLDILGTVKTLATTEKFVAKQRFVKDSKEIKFYGIWDNFTSWFLADDGKIEEHVGEQTLSYGNLTKDSVDGPIIEELGGEAKVETTLSAVYDLLLKQPKGEEGVMLTNGYANIFYIKDINGTLRVVGVYWRGGGWGVHASSVENTRAWSAGYRVFSANS